MLIIKLRKCASRPRSNASKLKNCESRLSSKLNVSASKLRSNVSNNSNNSNNSVSNSSNNNSNNTVISTTSACAMVLVSVLSKTFCQPATLG